jgi:hypothetical protein
MEGSSAKPAITERRFVSNLLGDRQYSNNY